MDTADHNRPVKKIPPASEVRASLCAALLEVQLLRGLLKVAERKERQSRKGCRKAVANVTR